MLNKMGVIQFNIGIAGILSTHEKTGEQDIARAARIEKIKGYKAFEIYGELFIVHKEVNCTWWTVSHYKTGAGCNVSEPTMKRAIAYGYTLYETKGEKKTLAAIKSYAKKVNEKQFKKPYLN